MTSWPMRSRSGSEASVLSIHFAWRAVSAARGSNGPGSGVGGAGSGVGEGRGGMTATVVVDGRELCAHDAMAPSDASSAAAARLRA